MNRRGQRIRRGIIVASLVVLALTLTACAPSDLSVGRTGKAAIASLRVPMTSFLRSHYYKQSIDWRNCDKNVQCGDVLVPLDWQNVTSSGAVHVALIRHRATGTRYGALVVDPGGPGDSGVELVDGGVQYAVDKDVATHYDVIGIDPRGVGFSTPIKCLSDKQQDAYLYAPTVGAIGSTAWLADQDKRARTLANACVKNTGPLIAHVDTINAAHDLDVVRAALGEKKLNYLGYSYGTYLGTVYAGLYPAGVGRMVFDGPDNPWADESGQQSDDAQSIAFDGDLVAFLKSCLAGSAKATGHIPCAFSGSLASTKTRVESLLSTADKHPIPNSDGRVMDGATLASGISDALYDTTEWPDLNKAFTQVIAGKATEAFVLADEYNDRDSDGSYYDNSTAAFNAISCLEGGHSVDLAADARELKKLKKYAPMLGPYDAYGDIYCSGWKFGPSVFPLPIHAAGSGPILMVATTGDPATPYGEAKQLEKQLVTSHLITYHGEGHTAYDEGHPCVDKAVDAYLLNGTVPTTDPQCRD
jgi:pimeloyl-ACP methyl ester carboxylesterase